MSLGEGVRLALSGPYSSCEQAELFLRGNIVTEELGGIKKEGAGIGAGGESEQQADLGRFKDTLRPRHN